MTTFREATAADAEKIVEFQLALAEETEPFRLDREIVTRGVARVFAQPLYGKYYVAEKDGQVIGTTLTTFEWSDWRDMTIWWIQSVYVAPEHRNQGVWKGLYEHVKQIAINDPGVCGLRLYVENNNKRAQTAYEKLGMNGDHYRVFEWMKGGF